MTDHLLEVYTWATDNDEDVRQAVRDHLAEKGDHPTEIQLTRLLNRMEEKRQAAEKEKRIEKLHQLRDAQTDSKR